MRRARGWIAVVLLGALAGAVPADAQACIWDRDTLAMERQRFPEALELITGHFVHHGPEFYTWRIEDRTRRLEEGPNDLQLLDDLAAAHDKTGEHEAAIATMERALAIDPDRYETQANLGTFHAHAGHFDQALQRIDRALEINPDAHFGRERYQALLIRYLQSYGGGARLPMSKGGRFADYIAEHGPKGHPADQRAKAVRGVLGMMHFGKHDSPILLEALADLLIAGSLDEDASQLAARAYLRASHVVEDSGARKAYRAKARSALDEVDGVTLRDIEADLERELARAQGFVAKMRADEEEFLDADDPEAAFDAVYFDGMDMRPPDPVDSVGQGSDWVGPATGGLVALVALVWGAAALRRRRRGF